MKDVFKDIEKAEKKVLKEAAVHVQLKMKEKAKNKFKKKTGALLKGIGYKIIDRDTALVGAGPPAYHAHLLELGTMDRKTKTGLSKGRIIKTPFMIPTFEEESEAVKRIMSGLTV